LSVAIAPDVRAPPNATTCHRAASFGEGRDASVDVDPREDRMNHHISRALAKTRAADLDRAATRKRRCVTR
jgi:hypothetical protein